MLKCNIVDEGPKEGFLQLPCQFPAALPHLLGVQFQTLDDISCSANLELELRSQRFPLLSDGFTVCAGLSISFNVRVGVSRCRAALIDLISREGGLPQVGGEEGEWIGRSEQLVGKELWTGARFCAG
ncbi:uncharacterized protein LOC110109772 [Dendrobium catenatum]|uniref:uncharacterized protein LOC110109772 n=1 Tax=Dendrobium catenatum TaxID=906689 RepID=UPI0010A0C225|nr:uncharacterized protein LOC110109772 [Dendrobium catenatum]